jgi:murein biosynthesis integral membrane protein MurJ
MTVAAFRDESEETELDLSSPEGAVGDSLSVAIWTIVSRFTGVLRGVVVAAVLGATYFANTYQFTNSLPNLIFYGLLAGALFSSILVPVLVPHVDSGDSRATARTAGGLLGVAMLGMVALIPLAALGTPLLLRLGSIGAANAAAARNQEHIGAVLILLFLPQIVLYAVVGTATAVMNAHRRFALASAAPALENIGTIIVLGVVAVVYARAAREHVIPSSLVLLLGVGTTGAVLLHASAQWWGARRVGVSLRPNAGWRSPEVRQVIRRARPAAVQAGMEALQFAALLLVADRVAGGVVAFQLAMNFFFLPVALGASPVALSLMPRLSRMTGPGQAQLFRDTYVQGLGFAAFLVVPAAVAYAVLAEPLARAIGFGGFGGSGAVHLIAASLIGLAPGIIGQTLFLVTTYACYARGDTSYPLRGMLLQAAVCACVISFSYWMHGADVLTVLGLALSAGTITGSLYLASHLWRDLPRGGESVRRPALYALAGSAIMIGPAWATAKFLGDHLTSHVGDVVAMLAAVVVGASCYFAVQAILRAPQMQWVAGALLARAPGGFGSGTVSLPGPLGIPQRMRWDPETWSKSRQLGIDLALLLGCAAVGAIAAYRVKYALAALVLIGLSALIGSRPAWAAYLLIFLTPLIVGLNAGSVIPLVRPNEALIPLFGAIIAARWLVLARTGRCKWPSINRLDVTLVALAVASSILPLMMMVVRDRAITSDDLLYAIVLWKLLAEYLIVRSAVTTREQVMRCLWLSMWSAWIVSVVGILQSLKLSFVTNMLVKYYTSANSTSAVSIGRGSSLLGLPAAVGDLAILNLAIAIALLWRGHRRRLLLVGFAVTYTLGVVAAAEFTSVIGLLVAFVVIVMLTRSGRMVAYAIPVALLGAAVLWPVIETRLAGFGGGTQLPTSWLVRLDNLETYFWPQLFSDWNWILGVRPSARVAVPIQEYGYVWIESGYTWLLWGGGIPLVASYFAFVWVVVRKGFAYARRADAAGIVGFAVATAVTSQAVTMIFDPHLTFRGSGDAIFMILALLRVLPRQQGHVGLHRTFAEADDAEARAHEILAGPPRPAPQPASVAYGQVGNDADVTNTPGLVQHGRGPKPVATRLSRGHIGPTRVRWAGPT